MVVPEGRHPTRRMISKVAASLLWFTFAVQFLGSDAACLDYVGCYDDLSLDPDAFRTHHSDLEERSAVSCATTCLQRWPDTRVVLSKLVEVGERLECGCGDDFPALFNRSGAVNDYYNCYVCPEVDNQKCGSERTSSIYRVDHRNRSCARVYLTIPEEVEETTPVSSTPANITVPLLSSSSSASNTTAANHSGPLVAVTVPGSPGVALLGCFPEDQVNETAVVTVFLQKRWANVTHCIDACIASYPGSDLFLLKLLNYHRLYCGCGRRAALGPGVGTGQCHLYCHEDPRQPCGGWTSVTAYVRSAGSVGWQGCVSPTLLMGFLFLLLVM